MSGESADPNSSQETPTCVSIILCDDLYRVMDGAKLAIIGTFNAIKAPNFPAVHSRMWALFTVTNCRGEYDFSLTIENASTGLPLFEVRGPFRQNDPSQIADFHLCLQGVVFPEPGKYWLVLKSDGEIIGQRPLLVEHYESNQSNS